MRPIQEYEEYLKPDKHRLDECLEEQSQLYWEVSKACAEAQRVYNVAYANRKAVQGEAYGRCRAALISEHGKATEAQIAAAVEADRLVEKARMEELDAQQEFALWSSMKDAYTQRSYSLKDLAGLYTANYYQSDTAMARPQVTRKTPEELHASRKSGS